MTSINKALLEKFLNPDYIWQDEMIDNDEYDALFIAIMLDYLQKMPVSTRQEMILSWNFDNSHEILNWVIEQADTDKGTILYLYWYMQPGFQKRYLNRQECEVEASWYLSSFDLIAKIEEKFCAGFYPHQRYDFDPQYDCYQDGYDWTSELEPESMKRSIPEAMFTPLHGEILEVENWDEGIPEALYSVMDRLYDRLED